jgi:hypothetical protein
MAQWLTIFPEPWYRGGRLGDDYWGWDYGGVSQKEVDL